ncbi:hypothetical protein HBH56_151600 [Parastagonospora nodorum]|uniref:2EXR domain-containing protein n=1 Tax=Phaeosphaeria nodorum (strain SN15 / ATCC MYA-4574 / FGSC 10173) TaxID=321614 RepID=A0A7U2EZW4_PHANO|nr:hypothetical protein HBH56_151600 [Parastagonospora nodorum]QRC96158.1 hypothetical protein JI435_433380 [Parastagonospora nodorum SN15]KAH3926695.1 hypothetical protein HBH54_166100 [Parastagonospora nodorum]KAH3940365.1 hypothetical protein HBH53_219070 [Parastagonospora nodorum]KAH3996942.1 hypothetical protein HBI10_154150 [Parastagonospora nodorum]
MVRDSTATFHYLPRLPAKLRFKIRELFTAADRVFRVCERCWAPRYLWSPSPVPPVTRASQEARKHCRYRRFFVIEGAPQYIWICFETDRIRILSSVMSELYKGTSDEKETSSTFA